MIQNLHLLLALPSESGVIAFAAKRAEHLPIEGLRLYFPSGHQTRGEKIAYWLKRLNRDPVSWVEPSEETWVIYLEGAKQKLADELSKSYPYKADIQWPHWLLGSISVAPELETGTGFQPRLAFYITERVVAKSKHPVPHSAASSAAVVNQFFTGGYHVSSDQYHVSGQVGAVGPNAKAEGNTFAQQWSNAAANIDLPSLAAELAQLRSALRKEAQELEHDQAIASVASAEAAAKQSDGPSALKHLKAAGKWALEVATKIGTSVAEKAIENALKG